MRCRQQSHVNNGAIAGNELDADNGEGSGDRHLAPEEGGREGQVTMAAEFDGRSARGGSPTAPFYRPTRPA
ncbi:hypothetical protein BaRGS_00020073 [Batillaria attramentaria]|uniref:Uncharacterized protein n=1 Tax=Batillaria attramentaria TaxID=370345 RepID=A0ABD0KP99_9CAEN